MRTRPLKHGVFQFTSIRIMPSCRDVMNSSPSRLRPMCRSARVMAAPIVLFDEFLQRHILALAAGVAHIELDLFDRRHGLRNAVVGLLHRRKVGGEQASALDIAEHELAAKSGDPAVIGEAIGDRAVLRRGRRSRPDR